MIIYRGLYKDIETNVANENIQATKRIDIIDQESNPYNIVLTSQIVGPNIEFTFTFDTLPDTAFQTQIVWSNDAGVNWTAATGGTTSPQTITLPLGDYVFQFVVYFPDNVTVTWDSEDQVIELEMTDSPASVVVIDNDEDKFTPIRAKQLQIQFYSSNTISINTFSQGGDTRFKCNYYVSDVLKFTGFLSIGDLSQEFMPDPNRINLIAVDGLGFLNDIPLTDFDETTPSGEQSILDILCWALKGTGLQLNIRAMFNIREVTASTLNNDGTGAGHLFKWCYLDAKTFEAEVGECEDCYTVITKILGEEAVLFQYLGEWRIMRIDEMEHGLAVGTWFQWNYQGNFLGKFEETHEANIGDGEAHSWMNDDALVMIEQLVRESRLSFKYETPKEVPCNIDFERGDLIDGSTPTDITYALDCWTLKEGVPGSPGVVDGTTVTIHRIFNANDYEIERYIVLTPRTTFEGSSTTDATYIESEKIYINEGDKFEASIDFKLTSLTVGTGSRALFRFVLHGDDGSWWILDSDNTWLDTVGWTQNSGAGGTTVDFNEADWQNIAYEAHAAPVSGNLYVWINQLNQSNSAEDNHDIKFSGLSFTYIPLINGSYRKYTGQEHKVAQDVDRRNTREKDVFVSDSPRKLFKGALLIVSFTETFSGTITFAAPDALAIPGNKTDIYRAGDLVRATGTLNLFTKRIVSVVYHVIGDTTDLVFSGDVVTETVAGTIESASFPLAGLFYNAATEPDGVVNAKPYGEIQSFDVWNQVNRTMVKFDGAIDHTSPEPDLINKYFLTDNDVNSSDRVFILLHYELDTHYCETTVFLVEVSNNLISKVYIGHSFKYLTNE